MSSFSSISSNFSLQMQFSLASSSSRPRDMFEDAAPTARSWEDLVQVWHNDKEVGGIRPLFRPPLDNDRLLAMDNLDTVARTVYLYCKAERIDYPILVDLYKLAHSARCKLGGPLRTLVDSRFDQLKWDPKLGLEGVRFSRDLSAKAGFLLLTQQGVTEEELTGDAMDLFLRNLYRNDPTRFHYLPTNMVHAFFAFPSDPLEHEEILMFIERIKENPHLPIIFVFLWEGQWRGLLLVLEPTPVVSLFCPPLEPSEDIFQLPGLASLVAFILRNVQISAAELRGQVNIVTVAPQVGSVECGHRLLDAILSYFYPGSDFEDVIEAAKLPGPQHRAVSNLTRTLQDQRDVTAFVLAILASWIRITLVN
ncbi:hypothetical protein JCM3765_000456 [Sporobolomyces pararoseus]